MNKVSVYGSFTQALFFSGVVAIPKYLLSHYKEIGLNDHEMMVLIQILCEAETNPYPSILTLAGRMTTSPTDIEEVVGRLVELKLLAIERHWNPIEEIWGNSYSFVGLMDELAELWAIERSQQVTGRPSSCSNTWTKFSIGMFVGDEVSDEDPLFIRVRSSSNCWD